METLNRHLSWGGIIAVACIAGGSQWDTYVHLTKGHVFLEPAHLLLLAGLALFSICGVSAFVQLRTEEDRRLRVGTNIVAWGGTFVFFSMLILDELWHLIFGLDQTAWSPPHMAASLGMLTALFGMMLTTLTEIPSTVHLCSLKEIKAVLIFSAMLIVVLFNFIEFDLPTSLWLARTLPGFFYPIFLSSALVFFFLLVFLISGTIGTASLGAIIAWVFFTIAGLGVEAATQFSYMKTPFPVFIPALVFDAQLFIVYRQNVRPSRTVWSCFALAISAWTASYWGLVGWGIMTKLPQRISGGEKEWLIWYFLSIFIIPVLLSFLTLEITQAIFSSFPEKNRT